MGLVLNPEVSQETNSGPGDVGPRWNFVQRVAFRFVFLYLVLYILPFPIGPLDTIIAGVREIVQGKSKSPDADPFDDPTSFLHKWVAKPYEDLWDKVILWTGQHVFDLEITYRPLGSGDTTWNYVQVFLFAVFAAVGTFLWTLAASLRGRFAVRWRADYPVLHEWLRVYVRFYVAYQMVVYGSFKVIKLQFGAPEGEQLLHSYGESSPMNLLWTFMGASDGYTWFAGAGELLGGLLLCFRRTTLLGALVTFGVMVHVAALNYCYDVPVKLFSSHLVLMSVFLQAPDLPWLASVFVLGRRARPRPRLPLTRRHWLNVALVIVRTLVVAAFLWVTFSGALEMSRGLAAPPPPLFGLWDVEEFSLDGNIRPPLTTDAARWHRVTFTRGGFGGPRIILVPMKGYAQYYPVMVDREARTVVLTRAGGPPESGAPPVVYAFKYDEPEPGAIVLDGEMDLFADGSHGRRKVHARLRQVGDDKFILKSRGFHWINELPYNRNQPRDLKPLPERPAPKRD